MAWWSTPQPQEDEQSTAPMPLLPVDPDYTPLTEENGPFIGFPAYPLDEDGWPIIPSTEYRPPLWSD